MSLASLARQTVSASPVGHIPAWLFMGERLAGPHGRKVVPRAWKGVKSIQKQWTYIDLCMLLGCINRSIWEYEWWRSISFLLAVYTVYICICINSWKCSVYAKTRSGITCRRRNATNRREACAPVGFRTPWIETLTLWPKDYKHSPTGFLVVSM